MGKFMNAKFDGKCNQTGKSIKVGDYIYYVPGRGMYSDESKVYAEHKGGKVDAENDRRSLRSFPIMRNI